MSTNINNTTISIMFEEIKQAVKQLGNKLNQREQCKDDSPDKYPSLNNRRF